MCEIMQAYEADQNHRFFKNGLNLYYGITKPIKKEIENMPLITVEAGVLNKEQKKQLAKEITTAAAKIMNVPE